jgi:hypothetical protein
MHSGSDSAKSKKLRFLRFRFLNTSVVDPDPESDPDPVGFPKLFAGSGKNHFRIQIQAALSRINWKKNFSDEIHYWYLSTKCTFKINIKKGFQNNFPRKLMLQKH